MSVNTYTEKLKINSASFRDPSGFVFMVDDEIYRAIAPEYFNDFFLLEQSGLYKRLTGQNLLLGYSTTTPAINLPDSYSDYKIISQKKIPFISYPYEWCFSQLKDAALLTLKIQKESLKHGMTLKDASAFNVQFMGSAPIFIDTLSFEKYEEGKPWVAYRQFCQHFLAPLALMHYKRSGISKLSQSFTDGIPLELAASLLPSKSVLNAGVASHILLHSKIQSKYPKKKSGSEKTVSVSKRNLLALIEHMEDCISGLKLKKEKSSWSEYDTMHNYSESALEKKDRIVSEWLSEIKPTTVWDLGSNNGRYSEIAGKVAENVVAFDSDHLCIDALYSLLRNKNSEKILPLILDLTNPSPSIGWANMERKTITERGKADVLLALALIHHLRIGNNVPFQKIAAYFCSMGDNLIIEFIPKEDEKIQQMLEGRKDIFQDYNNETFCKSFELFFTIEAKLPVTNSGRILFRMKKKL